MQYSLIVGVMGGGCVDKDVFDNAYRLGATLAQKGWILLNGGRNQGVMDASAKGAYDHGGMTIGILPGDDRSMCSPYIKIPIVTAMGSARNMINVLSADVVVALNGGAGTLSEVALALKHQKVVILLGWNLQLPFSEYEKKGQLISADTILSVVEHIDALFKEGRIGGR